MRQNKSLKKGICSLILMTVVSASLFANQEVKVLTFDEALSMAKAHSPMYKIADITRENSLLGSSAVSSWIPSVNFSSTLYSGMGSFIGETATNKFTTVGKSMLNFQLAASLKISASNFLNIPAAMATKESAEATYKETVQNYDTQIYAMYWGLKSYQLAAEAAEVSYNSAKNTYENVEKRYKVGRISSLERANAALSLSKSEKTLIESRTAVENQLVQFKTLIGYNSTVPFVLEDMPEAKKYDLPSVNELYRQYLSNSYSIQTVRAQEKAAKKGAQTMAWSARTPVISASFYWGVNPKDNNFKPADYTDGMTLSVSAAMSLDGFIPGTATYNQINTLQNSAEMAKLNREQTERTYLGTLEAAVGALNATYEALETAEITLALAQESYKLTKDSFEAGKSTMESFMNAESTLLNANVGLISSKMSYMMEVQELSTLLGLTIHEFDRLFLETAGEDK